jgi:hypothetical protein
LELKLVENPEKNRAIQPAPKIHLESRDVKDALKNKQPSHTSMPKKFESIDHTQITGEIRAK